MSRSMSRMVILLIVAAVVGITAAFFGPWELAGGGQALPPAPSQDRAPSIALGASRVYERANALGAPAMSCRFVLVQQYTLSADLD